MARELPPLPLPIQRALRKIGNDLRTARLRRRISTTLMAERALISRQTLYKVERGDAGVSFGIYATVLFILGFTDRLSELADPGFDHPGLQLAEEQLPQRIHAPKPHTPMTPPPRRGGKGS